MGTKCCTTKLNDELKYNEENIVCKIDFIKKYAIGRGGYGRVSTNINNFNFYYYFRFGKFNIRKIIKYML